MAQSRSSSLYRQVESRASWQQTVMLLGWAGLDIVFEQKLAVEAQFTTRSTCATLMDNGQCWG